MSYIFNLSQPYFYPNFVICISYHGYYDIMVRITIIKSLRTELLQAADACGELLWELPLFSEYHKDITSKIADLKNANYHGASSIKAGLFLQEFVGKIPFAHLDIAGTAFLSKPGFWLAAEGATGFGVRLLIEYLKNLTIT